MMNYKRFAICLLIIISYHKYGYCQKTQEVFVSVSLNDLSTFNQAGKKWAIGSDAQLDLSKPTVIELVKGAGTVLTNGNGKEKSTLVTNITLSDIELDFDFIMAKDTRAAVFLQGRYGIYLTDSWNKKSIGLTDCGGIVERWDETKPEAIKGFEGTAPPTNVCRAPGLWQHMKVIFRAPHVGENGVKSSNAAFEEVYLNGTLLHQHVQLSGPSRNALFADEKAKEPLVFQSENGPLALKNIRHRTISPLNATVRGLKYRYYKSEFKNNDFPDLSKLTVSAQDSLSQLTGNIGLGDEVYALDMNGIINLPSQDNYTMSLLTSGMGRLYIDDQLIIDRVTNRWINSFYTKQVPLAAGEHAIRLVYVKNYGEQKPGLVLTIKGVNTDLLNLNDAASTPNRDYPNPIFLKPQGSPYLLRSFLNYNNKNLTHTISVGDPDQVNYSYDLKQGALIQIWRGDFLDVTNMWLDRGEPQLAIPRGSVITLSDAPALAVLEDANTAWPDSVAFDDLQNKGYTLDESRAPSFRYVTQGANVSDKISNGENGASLVRQFVVSNAPANFYCRIASGNKIDLISKGLYRVDDKSYYIRIDKSYKPVLRQTQKGTELIVPIQNAGGSLNYSLTW